jgi:adenine-specific DNA-methyltransferase
LPGIDKKHRRLKERMQEILLSGSDGALFAACTVAIRRPESARSVSAGASSTFGDPGTSRWLDDCPNLGGEAPSWGASIEYPGLDVSIKQPTVSPSPGSIASAADPSGEKESRRKANGVYYTPPRLARLLTDWALAEKPQRVLEPSYGEGVFLRAAEAKLRRSGVGDPSRRLFGVELDVDGPNRLERSGLKLKGDQLYTGDLLALDAGHFGGQFEAILGNPPYIRHHLLDEKLAERGRASARLLGIELNGRSDAWAYFCAHLVTFLGPGGRLALVLPGSVLHADYAKPLLEALAKEEGEVQLVRIGERLFAGVQERTVLLLIDRAKPRGGPVIYRSIANLRGLGPALKRPPLRRNSAEFEAGEERQDPRLPWRLKVEEAKLWEAICALEGVAQLGDLTKIRIGVVTGANAFFIRSEDDAAALGKRVGSAPIVSRGAWLARPRWTAAAQRKVAAEPSRLLLFPNSQNGLSAVAKEELRRGVEEKLDNRSHCARRTPWYSITDAEAPDMFLPYMASQAPRLVINDAEATCTNSIHRVWLEPEAEASVAALAAASWSTLYRLSAELVGRSYGGGVLKLEPGGAMALRLPIGADDSLIDEIGDAYKDGGIEKACLLVDRRLLVDGLGVERREVSLLAAAANRLAKLRKR